MTCMVLKIPGQIFSRMCSNWDSSDVFLMMRLSQGALGRGTPEVSAFLITSCQGYALSIGFIICAHVDLDPTPHPQPRSCLSALCNEEVRLLFLLCLQFALEESHHRKPTLKKWGVGLFSLKAVCTHALFRILLHGWFAYSCLFIYLFNHLSPSAWTLQMHFMLWVIIQCST